MKALLGWILKVIAGLLCLVVIFLAVVTIFKIPMNLSRFKEPIERIATELLNRPVGIEKSIVLTTSLSPVFTLEGLRIKNPDGFTEETFMYLGLARIQVELLPLLKKKLHFAEVSVHGFELDLEEREDGVVNWVMTRGDSGESATPKPETAQSAPDAESFGSAEKPSFEVVSDTIVVRKLSLKDISVSLLRPGNSEPNLLGITSCEGTMLAEKPLQLDIGGDLLEFPYTLGIQIASLDEFLLHSKSWMEIEATIAETNLTFSGNLNLAQAHRALSLQAGVSGEDLSSLNDLLKLDLPPLQKYSVEAALLAKDEHLELENLIVTTGSSSLEGSAEITRAAENIDAELNLKAPLVQINDFSFKNWSWREGGTSEDTAEAETGGVEDEANRKLVDPELLKNIEAIISVSADEVLSGEDNLGSGSIRATLQEGRISIEPLELNVPGGAIKMTASLKPGMENSDASLAAQIENFDIGILVRRSKPNSQMGGLVNLDVDLKSSAATLDQLLANGSGYFDFSGQLSNMEAGIIDLWAVNLVASIVSSTDENQSRINCAVGRWSAKDGLLEPDVFFIDTSKIRICGSGEINFRDQSLDLTIAPAAKKAEFFSLATPLAVSGSFDDIGFGVERGGLIGTAVRFIASPITTPIKRVILDQIPKDGSDVCTVELGPANREEISVEGCN